MYKKLQTSTRPMNLSVDSKTYIDEWKSCWSDPDRCLTNLLEMSDEWVEHWVSMLTLAKPLDLNMLSMCQRLSKNPDEAIVMIENWVDSIKEDIRQELYLIFFHQLRNMRYYPTKSKRPETVEFVLARDFTFRLQRLIEKQNKKLFVDYTDDVAILHSEIYAELHPDILLISNMNMTDWMSYILELKLYGLTNTAISELTHQNAQEIREQENFLWKRIKTLLQKNET